MLGNKINVVVKTHPSLTNFRAIFFFFFQFVKIHCRDAGTDFCQARPIVNSKAFKNDWIWIINIKFVQSC